MIRANDVMSWDPCRGYSRETVERMVGDGVTPRQIADMDIPIGDRIWALLHVHSDLFDWSGLHLIACDFADQALALIADPDPRLVNAIAVKRRWVAGDATDSELAAARTAAWDAALDAAGDAALDASWDAAGAAARTAAWDAARTAARDAERGAARTAARDAERATQLEFILSKIQERHS